MESAASGIIAGLNAVRRYNSMPPLILPDITMTGALLEYITDGSIADFQPMGANFGILPQLDETIRDKRARYMALAERSLNFFERDLII